MLTFISLISTWSLANGNLLGHQGHAGKLPKYTKYMCCISSV